MRHFIEEPFNMTAPTLDVRHLKNCKVVPDRNYMLSLLKKGSVCAELGVAEGEFSNKILEIVNPTMLYLIDFFGGFIAYMPFDYTAENHEEFINNRFSGKPIKTLKGVSWEMLATFEDKFFDFIYIDAAHNYESVKRDIQVAKNKIKDDGLLIFNDYKMENQLTKNFHYLGVCRAVNEFCIEEDWEFVYFALQKDMFCDVAIRPIKE